jgi:hypothetical protein
MNANIDERNDSAITLEIELAVEELEEVIAPGQRLNHNETLLRDPEEMQLEAEELEETIAPRRIIVGPQE